MLTPEQLAELAADMESFRVERKASAASIDKIEETVCAFANDLSGAGKVGVIFVGVDDKSGLPTGLPITDALLLKLTELRGNGKILPFPQLLVYRAEIEGTPIAVVEVEPSATPPVRLRGRTVVRPGPGGATATREDERVLVERRRSQELAFDQRTVHGATLDDLDLQYFTSEFLPSAVDPGVLAENGRSVAEQLAALHLASPDAIPNVAGLLVLGRDPTAFIPGAYVQFVRFDGTEMTDPIVDRKELAGPLPRVLRQMDDITAAHIHVATDVNGRTESRAPDYPMPAMQQLLRNAVMHRNYETSHAPAQWYWFSDRIEIHNPGGLFGRATRETFGKPGGNDYRNPTVAAALYQVGLVQRFGMGVPLARKACADNANPEPEFIFDQPSFAAIVRARS
ncbi:ATP-binding protein [Enhygromyxa salina]|uniref:Divergent AAA domain protein n=1 Tax=Enhygromyxa salina TaxID=215803 RepID=A0A2S9YNH7_9BACT|nr:ATP-binding protein [Enhygromyxa salina]PRQ06609.1 Divergent AAA domain protein [Enhygromyxa salina]